MERGVLSDIQNERGLSHAGPRGHNDEIGRLQARCFRVEVKKSGGHSSDQLFALVELFHHLDCVHDHVAQLDERWARALF